jgi:thymidylate synthase (FAD)
MGDDTTVVESARMSTGRSFISWDDYQKCVLCGVVGPKDDIPTCKHVWKTANDTRFLRFLYREGHTSPFEMCELTFEVQAPIFVARQWMRHGTLRYNEFSGRYSVMPDLSYVPDASRFVSNVSQNKQEASEHVTFESEGYYDGLAEAVACEQHEVYATYERLLQAGVPKEVARLNTPLARYTRFRAKGNLRNWLHFLSKRLAPEAQYETRMYAHVVAEHISALFPRTYDAFVEYTLGAVTIPASKVAEIEAVLRAAGKSLS